MTTTGQQFADTIRKSFRINGRTKDRRDGGSIKADILESIRNAVCYPGYYGQERTELSRAAVGALHSFDKHVDGYRIDGELRFHIMSMTPYQFVGLLADMIDAGVTCTGDGEVYFREMARRVRSAA